MTSAMNGEGISGISTVNFLVGEEEGELQIFKENLPLSPFSISVMNAYASTNTA